MSLVTTGLNHLTAPVALRETVAIGPEQAPDALAALRAEPGVEEALILSTCNRTELLCAVQQGAESQPAIWLYRHHGLTPGKLDEFLYHYREQAAVRHLFRVACGLDSMVLGEPQILGQVKDAWQVAHQAGTLGKSMDRLLQNTFATAKQVRTETRIGAHSVSVALIAIRLAEQLFADLADSRVLLVGAGDTVELAARHLAERQVGHLVIANRSISHAAELAERHGGYAAALDDLPHLLTEADIVLSSTASPEPLIHRAMVAEALVRRRHKPMFLIDLAVPRDIDPSVAGLDDVFLYGIDELRQLAEENLRLRQDQARAADSIVDLHVERHMAWRRTLDQDSPLLAIRHQAESVRDLALTKARTDLANGRPPDEVLEQLAHNLANKLLHKPSASLRIAALAGDTDLLATAARLYQLDDKADKAE